MSAPLPSIPFVKMHGLGNDFVVLDGRAAPLPPLHAALVQSIADRHMGIGCDQVIALIPSATADLQMRIFNADGAEVEACGNATRAVGRLLGRSALIETLGGTLRVAPASDGIEVALPAPRFDWATIPLAYPLDCAALPVAWEELANPAAVNLGNPHLVFFVGDCDAIDLARLGPLIEHDPLFPTRINVCVATIETRHRLRLRVWERGAGLTRACGTGACASAVVAMRRGLAAPQLRVALPGGELIVRWDGNGPITMVGPAEETFRGIFDPTRFGALEKARA